MAQSDTSKDRFSGQPDAQGKIVELGGRLRANWCAPMRQLESYWSALRRGRVVPLRSEVDPRGIEGALSNAFVAELLAPGHARLRIAGTHLCDLMGMEVRGMPLSAIFTPVAREQLSRVLGDVFTGPARVDFDLVGERRLGKPEMRARMLLLPMADDFGDINRILGCLVSDGTIGRAPRRFEISRADVTPLIPETEVADPVYHAPTPRKREVAEAQVPFLRPSAVPYLRVLDGGSE